jgi:hypothetical protein
VEKGDIGDDCNEPDQDPGDHGADRANEKRHGGKQQDSQVCGKIGERIVSDGGLEAIHS